MKEGKGSAREIHISDIDSFLAERFVETGGTAIGFSVSRKDSQGNICVENSGKAEGSTGMESVDFELSPGESLNPTDIDIEQFIKRPVDTSSAYEFFDFLLANFSSFECVAEFTGNAWRFRIDNPSK